MRMKLTIKIALSLSVAIKQSREEVRRLFTGEAVRIFS